MSILAAAKAFIHDPSFIPMFRETIRRYLVWWMYGLAVFEAIAIVLKWLGVNVPLVSQVARDTLFGAKWTGNAAFTSLGYFFVGMGVHWFVTWGRPPLDGTRGEAPLAMLFWLVGVAYYVADKLDPNWTYWPVWAQWVRYPTTSSVLGGVLAFFCFAQKSTWAPAKFW